MWLVISNTPAIELDYVTGSPGGMSVWQINTLCEPVHCDSTYTYVENGAPLFSVLRIPLQVHTTGYELHSGFHTK